MKWNNWYQFALCFLFVAVNQALSADELKSLQLASPNGVIQVTDDNFEAILNGPKDYYLVASYTATNKDIPCDLCKSFAEFYNQVAYSYFHDYHDMNNVFFINIEYTNNPVNFKELGMKNVPHIWVYPPALGEYNNATSAHFVYQIPEPPNALHFAQFLSQTAAVSIVVRETDSTYKFVRTFVVTLGGILLIKKRGPRAVQRLTKGSVYQLLSIAMILLFTGGYSFTLMRGVPFLAKNDKNEQIYISGGVSYQFGVEILIVGLNYLALATTVVALIKLQNSSLNIKYKNALTLLGTAAVYLLYSCLTSIYLRKDGGYPYAFSRLF